jgi:hypothetical protein
MTVTGHLDVVAFDAADIDKLANFYATLARWHIAGKDSDWIALQTPDGPQVAFQLAPDHVAPQWPDPERPQQAHLDIAVDDLDSGETRALELGATRLAGGGESFRVFADPAGHPFCLTV